MRLVYILFSLAILTSCNQEEVTFSYALDIFPNPCVDIVSISATNSEPENMHRYFSIRIVDAKTDEVIASASFSKNVISIDMSNEEVGEYYAQIVQGDEVIDSDVFIKAR